MTAAITYVPRSQARVSSSLEDALSQLNEGRPGARSLVRLLAWPLWRNRPEDYKLAVDDACQLLRDRDDIEPPATRTWQEVCGEDYAASQADAYERKAAEADQAVTLLRLGPGWLR
jgi:hypothetical protein